MKYIKLLLISCLFGSSAFASQEPGEFDNSCSQKGVIKWELWDRSKKVDAQLKELKVTRDKGNEIVEGLCIDLAHIQNRNFPAIEKYAIVPGFPDQLGVYKFFEEKLEAREKESNAQLDEFVNQEEPKSLINRILQGLDTGAINSAEAKDFLEWVVKKYISRRK